MEAFDNAASPEIHDLDESSSETGKFHEFLLKLRDVEQDFNMQKPEYRAVELQHSGVASFLDYDLGNLAGSDFELLTGSQENLYREISDHHSNTSLYILPLLCARPCLLKESRLVNDKGRAVTISYKETNENTPTTASYPFSPSIFGQEDMKFYTISKNDLVGAFRSIRKDIIKKIIDPISRATGYKWQYSQSSYKDKVYFLEFNCFQDSKSKCVETELIDRKVFNKAFLRCPCKSSIHIGIHIFNKKCIVNYHHTPHTKLVEIVFALLAHIYVDNR